jgi:hypothetical protein
MFDTWDSTDSSMDPSFLVHSNCVLLHILVHCYDFSPQDCMVHKDQMIVGP